MPAVKELKEHLKTYKNKDIIAFAIWTPEDAIWQAKREGHHLTEEQAAEVIEKVHQHHDAELGINWDTLSCYISDFDNLPDIPEDCPHPDDSFCYDCKKCEKGV